MNYLLLDADIIIDLHELDLWDAFVSQNDVFIASTVIHTEALHYFDKNKTKIYIDLQAQLKAGKIKELSAIIDEQKKLFDKFEDFFQSTFDAGELESITIIDGGANENLKFCTSDGAAIVILSMLQLEHKGISVENALKHSGIKIKNILYPKHYEKRFKKLITEGKQNIISGKGFRKA